VRMLPGPTALISLLIAAPMLLWAESPAPAPTAAIDDDGLNARVQEILLRTIDDEDYAGGERCLTRSRFSSVEIIDDQRIAFIGRGDNIWLNQLRSPCFGLRPGMTLEMHTSGARLCRTDDVYGADLSAIRDFDPGSSPRPGAAGNAMQPARRTARCSLGAFEKVTPEQLRLLREALSAARS
jgi:hypothetical protein